MERPFIYPERISADRAQAVRRLVEPRERRDTEEAWTVLRKWVKQEGIVAFLQDVAAILDFNGLGPRAQARLLNSLATFLSK